ncbi:MAG TPA: exosortase A [Gammaproteobacteria bacterium]|nr:exosortase A [Gammaproteobacteria bacterium]
MPGTSTGQETVSGAADRQVNLASAALALLFALLLYHESWLGILHVWMNSQTYAHGVIILPIVAWLLWRNGKRHVIAFAPQPAALLPLALMVLLQALARSAGVAVVEQFAVIALLPALLWALLGTDFVRRNAFALAYLFFAVPFGDFLIPHLQDLTANYTVKGVRLAGIPVYQEGVMFYLPSGSFAVAKACSGIRYLIASVALGTLYAFLVYSHLWKRLLFIGLSIAVPVLANIARATGIVLMAHYSDYALAKGVDHIIYGWLFFGVVMFLLFWLGGFFADRESAKSVAEASPESQRVLSARPARIYSTLLLVLAVLAAGPAAESALSGAPTAGVTMDLEKELLPPPGWSCQPGAEQALKPRYAGVTRETFAACTKNGIRVRVYAGFYATQQQGRELISDDNSNFDRQELRRSRRYERDVRLPRGEVLPVNVEVAVRGRQEYLVYSWYEIAGRPVRGAAAAKMLDLFHRLVGDNRGALVMVLSTAMDAGESRAQQVLDEMSGRIKPRLSALWRETTGQRGADA